MGARVTAAAGVALAATLLLGACGSGDEAGDDPASPAASSSSSAPVSPTPTPSPTPTTTPAPAGMAACAEVWQVGGTLPKGYDGCAADGLLVAPDPLGCSSGQVLVRYDDRFWAVRGGEISGGDTPLQDSGDYRKVVATCRG